MSLALAIDSRAADEIYLCPAVSVISYSVHLYVKSSVPIFLEQRHECIGRCSLRTPLRGHQNRGGKSIWSDCRLPAFAPDNKHDAFSAGLCATVRRLSKLCTDESLNPPIHPHGILGFRKSCLQAPSEASSWTKFCETEAVQSTERTLASFIANERPLCIPRTLDQFQKTMEEPPRLHNAGRVARILGKEIVRDFAEGPYFTLADILLYPSVKLTLSVFDEEALGAIESRIPLVFAWMRRVELVSEFRQVVSFVERVIAFTFSNTARVSLKNIDWSSWTTDDVKQEAAEQGERRTFIHDEDLETALNFLPNNALLELSDSVELLDIEWSSLPLEATPFGGCLPDKRAPRKLQQLQNLVSSVMKIAKSGDRIVDFCSGGGHLGILLAYLLPACEVVLVENKEHSLNMARKRINTLEITNVILIQCNLDHFIGRFNIGVALHACGPATDLVLENCIEKKASFVICPCCYGSVHETDRLKYPRSSFFSEIPIHYYLRIGHSADQTHANHPMEERGVKCMRIIDSDRAHHAKSYGYDVILMRLKPTTCTPKNMLIVGNYVQ